jgi:hypothetical protein
LGGEGNDMRVFAKKTVAQLVLGAYLLVLLPVLPAYAKKAILKDIEITNTESYLLLYFNVDDCFTEDMKKAIDNGINTTFNFFIRVYEARAFWRDKKIADIKVKHHVRYDCFKKVYMVRLLERGDETIIVQDFDEVKKLMSGITGLKVVELQNLQRDRSYQVRMTAELDKIRLPLNLHYVFFFLSLWDFETDWYTVDFTY